MMATRGLGLFRLDRLGPRLATLLTFALLPLGAIAIVQTFRLIDEAEAGVEAALIGATNELSAEARGLLQTTIGQANALAYALDRGAIDDGECGQLLRGFVDRTEDILFAGYVELDGGVTCASHGAGMNLRDVDGFDDLLADPRITVAFEERGAITGQPVEIVTVPVRDGDALSGFFSISMRHRALTPSPAAAALSPLDIVTFNDRGQLLTSTRPADETLALLPEGIDLTRLTRRESGVIRAPDAAGERRLYTVAPLAGGAAYALVAWPADLGITGLARLSLPTMVVPLMMWLASLLVAYFAVNRLVIRHIRRLRNRIRVFSASRRLVDDPDEGGQPYELREVADSFDAMATTIARDEAELENMIHEKDVLLREVYHRVRNNLQLIASIANMQTRLTDNPETRQILRRLQDRIMGMATIHQSLYSTSPLSRVRADALIRDLIDQASAKADIADGRVSLTSEIAPVRLYPDQAVPLALLVYEALMNALKYVEAGEGGAHPEIRLRLKPSDDRHLTLEVRNTRGATQGAGNRASVGLGTQLIHAFTAQLEGHVETGVQRGWFVVRVGFQASDFGPEDGEDWLTDPLGRSDPTRIDRAAQ